MQKVGRNDPCPCGSGKKFKKCCEESTQKKLSTKKISSLFGSRGGDKLSSSLFQRVVQMNRPMEEAFSSISGRITKKD